MSAHIAAVHRRGLIASRRESGAYSGARSGKSGANVVDVVVVTAASTFNARAFASVACVDVISACWLVEAMELAQWSRV